MNNKKIIIYKTLVLVIFTYLLLISSSDNYEYKIYSNATNWIDIIPRSISLNPLKDPPIIAILDTGVDFSNGLLTRSKFLNIDITPEISSNKEHGTNVAGIIASDSPFFKGILPKAKLISIKLGDGSGWDSNKLAEGIELAISFKPDVINISCGTNVDNEKLRNSVKRAYQSGIIIVASAGNDGINNCEYPAAYPEVISVGAIDRNYEISNFSNYGSVKIFAPGEDILTTSPGLNKFNLIKLSGTSFAAPFVTCLTAKLKVNNPSLKPSEIVKIVLETSDSYYDEKKKRIIKIINYYKALNIQTKYNQELLLTQNKRGD